MKKIEMFVREHPVASGTMAVAAVTIMRQRTQINALTSFIRYLTHEMDKK